MGAGAWLGARAAWLALAIPAVLALTSLMAVVQVYSPTPFQDQWENIYWWREIQAHGLSFDILALPHNEHRIFFPRLVFFADLAWFGGRNILSLAATGAIQVAGALVFLLPGLRRKESLPLLGSATAAALLASLAQWENFFWGFQVQFVAVHAAGAWAIVLFSQATARGARPAWGRLLGAALLLVVAGFSMANGLFAGLAMGLAALAARRSWRASALAFGATALLAGLYLHGYHMPAGRSPAGLVLAEPIGLLTYVLAYLGNVGSVLGTSAAIALGVLGAALTGLMALTVWRSPDDDRTQTAMLGIALFVGLSAGATAIGRLGLTHEAALPSRYATASCYFWAAQAVFWSLRATTRYRPAVTALLALMLAGLLPLQLLMTPGLAGAAQRIAYGSSAMLAGVDDERALTGLYPEAQRIRDFTPFLRERRLSLFAEEAGLPAGSVLSAPQAPAQTCRGDMERWEPGPDGTARAGGRAWDAAAGRPFARVVLADDAGVVRGEGLGGLAGPRIRHILLQPHDRWVAAVAPGSSGAITAYGIMPDGAVCALARREKTP